MSAFLKPLAVLLISILVFAGVAWLADRDFLDYIQTHFYNPSIVKTYITENAKDAELAEEYIFDLQDKFALSLKESAVRRSFLYNQSADDIFERSKIFGMLLENTSGLQSVQFIDANGIRIHFSTSSRDIISQTATQMSYRNYTEDSLALPFETISVSENELPKFTMDNKGERIIFSYPFTDAMNVYHGTALFSVSSSSIVDKLVAEGRLKVNETVSVIMIPPGVLFGSPAAFKTQITDKVSEIWSDDFKDRITISSVSSNIKYSLISYKSERGIYFGRLVNDELFYISDSMKNILYIAMFLTFYLALFFILNFKPSPVTVVRNRIRRLRETLFEQLYEDKSTQEKIRWLLELEQRRDEIKHELKYKLRINAKTDKILNNIIDKSWDEIIAVVQTSSGHAALALKLSSLDAKEIVRSFGPRTDKNDGMAAAVPQKSQLVSAEFEEEIDQIEEAEEITITSAEDITEIEEADALESIEEIEEIEDLEDIDITEKTAEKPVKEIQTASPAKTAKPTRIFDDLSDYIEELGEDQITIEFSHPAPAKTPEKTASKGLLRLASEIAPSKGLLRLASEYITEPSYEYPTRGLLARAIAEIRKSGDKPVHGLKTKQNKKGLLALASEIEFSKPIKESDDIDESIDDIINMDIVSPFVSMFSSLDDIKI